MKLKTLKDIELAEKERVERIGLSVKAGVLLRPEFLRQEAIKHIKDLKSKIKRFEENMEELVGSIEMIKHWKSQIEWIKTFFNIEDKQAEGKN